MTTPSATWGLDMSTSKAKTAAVAITWKPGEARIVDIRNPLHAADIATLIAEHGDCSWAVDVPFGWPDRFVALMASRHEAPLPLDAMPLDADWEVWRTQQIAQRRTDAFLTTDPRIKTRPLPASFQLLGATAAMWVLIEARLVTLGLDIDRAGIKGSVCETYPRAALSGWGFKSKSKADWPALQRLCPFLTVEPGLEKRLDTDDVCDAVACALVARAREKRQTIQPHDDDELAAARREGWIHVSVQDPRELLA